MLSVVFEQQTGVISYLRAISCLSKWTKKTFLTLPPPPVKALFQGSALDKELSSLKEVARAHRLLLPVSLGIQEIRHRFPGWQTVTASLNARRLVKTGVGFVLRHLKQPWLVTVAKMSCSFIHKSMVFSLTPLRPGCL